MINYEHTIKVYEMIIIKKSKQLVELSYSEHSIEDFNNLFKEIQETKKELDLLKDNYEQYYKLAGF